MGCCRIDPTSWPSMPEQEAKRLKFTIGYLATGSDAAAAEFSGLSKQHTRVRLVDYLARHGSFSEAPHPRASPKFTPQVLEEAKDYMVAADDVRYTCGQVIAHLVDDGLLDLPVNHTNFLRRFKEYLAGQGCTLVVNSTSMVFEITPDAARQRAAVAEQFLQELGSDYQLEDIIFEDETTFEEGPHPKGVF